MTHRCQSPFQNENYPSDIITATLWNTQENWENYWEISPFGMALVDDKSEKLIGLFLYRKEGLLYFMDLWEYKDVFCTYLNLGCKPNSNGVMYLDNRIPWFDRFIFFNGWYLNSQIR